MKLTFIAFAVLAGLASAAPGRDHNGGYPPHPPPPPPHGKPPPPPPPPDHGKPPPPPPSGKCTPGTYTCTTNPQTGEPGWQICNTSGQYEYGGDCPPNTVCKFYEPSKSPYCVPPDFVFP